MSFINRILDKCFTPFSLRVLFRFNLLILPLAACILFVKLHKYIALSNTFDFGSLYDLFRFDLLFILVFSLIFLFWLDRTTGWLQKTGFFLLHVSVLFCIGISLLEHGFFLITGTVGDWYLFKYTLSNIGMLWDLLKSQLSVLKVLLGSIILVLNLLPIYLEKKDKIKNWLEQKRKPPSVWLYKQMAFALLVVYLAIFGSIENLEGKTRPLHKNAISALFADITVDTFSKKKAMAKRKSNSKAMFNTRELKFEATKKTKRWNIVFLVLESTRARSTTMYNKNLKTTPFMNKLSKRSILVEDMVPVMPHTSKALVSILCGIPPKVTMNILEGYKHGIPGNCLPKLLKNLGYESTFLQTATGFFEGRKQLVRNMGFDHFRAHEDLPKEKFQKVNYFGYEETMMIKPSFKWIEQMRKKKKPYFLTYLTLSPHHEYGIPNYFPKKKFTEHPDPVYHKYLNTIHFLDHFLKKLFAGFKKRGWMKDTLFILVGDHGEAFLEHKKRGHDPGVWEEMLRVPAIIHQPTLYPKAKRIKGLRKQMDFLPTIAEIIQAKITHGIIPGKSLFAKVSKNRHSYHTCWYHRYCFAKRTLHSKFIHNFGRMPGEYYNLKKDPMEKINLIKEKHIATKIPKLEEELLQWQQDVNQLYEELGPKHMKENISLTEPKVQVKLNIRFGPYIELVGYTLHTQKVALGRIGEISYVFKSLKPIPKGWRFFFHSYILKDKMKKYIHLRHIPLGGLIPLHQWKTGQYFKDLHKFHVRPSQGARRNSLMHLHIGIWKKGTGRLPVRGAHGRPHQKNSLFLVEIPIY